MAGNENRSRKSSTVRQRLAPETRAGFILDVSLDLFSRQSFANVTTRDIARACGVNVALIYYYYKNKDVLFHAVIERAIGQALERYRERRARATTPTEALDEWFQVNLELFTPLKKMAQILVAYNEGEVHKPSIDALIRRLYRSEQQILYRCIAAGVDCGEFRPVDARRAAVFISTHLDGLCFVSMTRPRTDMRKFINMAWEAIWDYLGVNRVQPIH